MTQLFLNPLTKFTSDNITALPGARLYFYQNNSSTPKAVYADKNKVTSLGVYVEADSAGIFEPIWLDGTYRATLKYSANWISDPVGVVQTGWPIDDIGVFENIDGDFGVDGNFNALSITLNNVESNDPKKIDYYAEDIGYTPIVFGGFSAGTATYSEQSGQATRFGNMVFFRGKAIYSSHTGIGNLCMTLPPVESIIECEINVSYENLVPGAGLQIVAEAFGDSIFFYACNPSTGSKATVNMDTSAILSVSGFYFCA